VNRVFADTHFFVAIFDRSDRHHHEALTRQQGARLIVTSEFVLLETLNAFAGAKQHLRVGIASFLSHLQERTGFEVVPCSSRAFKDALALYINRPDKGWSLTDCSSFLITEDLGITAALTGDKHFLQAGFQILFS
jgi:predicted nucleic acid-binding protein